MKVKKIFWGMFFICAGILLVTHQFGLLKDFSFWHILVTLLIIPFLIKSVVRLRFIEIFLSLAILYIMYQEPLITMGIIPLENEISTWIVLAAAVFLGIGFNILFKKRNKPVISAPKSYVIGSDSNNKFDVSVKFGSNAEYIRSESFSKVNLNVSFGEGKIFFNDSNPSPEGAVINIDCSFGNCELYLPMGWNIINNVDSFLANVDYSVKEYVQGAPEITLNGCVKLGNLSIMYV